MAEKAVFSARPLTSGSIVEFLHDNLIQIAWVLEEQGGKLRLMLPNRRESNLSSARVLPWHGPHYGGQKSKDEIIQLLQEHKDKRKQVYQETDFVDLWEMVQGEVTQERPVFFAELLHQEPNIDTIAAFAHGLLEHKDYFKFNNPGFEVYDQETVEKKLELKQQLQEKEVLIGGGANWFNHLWALHLRGVTFPSEKGKNPAEYKLEPQAEVAERLKNLLLKRIADPESQEEEALWKQIAKQLPEDSHLPLHLAIAWGLVPMHYNFWLDRADYDSSPNFAEEHEAYLQKVQSFVKELQSVDSGEIFSQNSCLREYDLQELHENSDFVAEEIQKTDTAHSFASSFANLQSKWQQNQAEILEESALLAEINQENNEVVGDDEDPCSCVEIEQKSYKSPLPNNEAFQTSKDFFAPFFAKDFISIDSASTKDIDDAFYMSKDDEGNFDVYIALACPAVVWEFNSPFDKCILQRTSSLYLPEGTYHMMPTSLSTEAFSLKEQEIRPCLICHCVISPQGEILRSNWDFQRSMVQDNLHYNACEQVLNDCVSEQSTAQETCEDLENCSDFLSTYEAMQSTENSEQGHIPEYQAERLDAIDLEKAAKHIDCLCLAHEFAKIRLAYRIEQGAVVIDKPDTVMQLEGEGANTHVHLFTPYPNTKAQLIISELMILANASLAEFAKEYNFPLLFRSQDIVLPKEFAGVWTKPQDIAKIARALSGAATDTVPKPHAGLALKAYSPVTSPLRRYVDLVNEAQLLHVLYCKKPLWTKQELDKLLLNLHLYQENVNSVQRMRPRYWRFVYLQQEAKRQGERCGFKAIVSDENDMYVTVTLCKEQLTVRAKRGIFGEKALLGEEVYVRLGKINPLKGEVSILAVR